MMGKKSTKVTVITALGLMLVVSAATTARADIWDFISGRQSSLIPVHNPAEESADSAAASSTRTVYKPVPLTTTLGDAVAAPLRLLTPSTSNGQQAGEYYTTRWVKVPTTRYVPQLQRNADTGWTQVVMKPCTSYTWQLRRVRTTDYRPLVPSLFGPACQNNQPFLARLLNPILAPGCYGCDVPASGSGAPTPSAGGADRQPSLDPNLVQPDTESDLDLRKPPIPDDASPAEGEESTEDAADSEGTDSEAADSEGTKEPAAEADAAADAEDATDKDEAAGAEEKPEVDKPASDDGTRSVLKQPPIEPPKQNKVPGQEKAEEDKKAADGTEDKSAAPYRLQPIPDNNRLPADPASVPELIDPRDKTAAQPIPSANFTATQRQPAAGSQVVPVTAVRPVSLPVRKLDSGGWVRVKH
jgi:hypothetical protein